MNKIDWYRLQAAEHGQLAADMVQSVEYVPDALAVDYFDGYVADTVLWAREAAHYALLVQGYEDVGNDQLVVMQLRTADPMSIKQVWP